MNNHQRGIYQPLVDNIPIYDLDDDGDDEERSRLPLLIVAGLIVMAAFTGMVWLAYNQGVERGRSGTMVVIPSPEGPARTAPSDAGGEKNLTGLKIYGQPVSPDREAQSSQLANNTPAITVAPPAVAPREAAPVRLNPPVAPQTQVQVVPPKPAVLPPPAAPVQVARPAPAAAVAALAPAAPPPAVIPAAAQAPATSMTGWVLQLGSYPSAEAADSSWGGFKRRFADVLGPLSNDVQRADLGQRGIFFRLRAGPFADKGEANTACQKLKAAGGNCIVTTP